MAAGPTRPMKPLESGGIRQAVERNTWDAGCVGKLPSWPYDGIARAWEYHNVAARRRLMLDSALDWSAVSTEACDERMVAACKGFPCHGPSLLTCWTASPSMVFIPDAKYIAVLPPFPACHAIWVSIEVSMYRRGLLHRLELMTSVYDLIVPARIHASSLESDSIL